MSIYVASCTWPVAPSSLQLGSHPGKLNRFKPINEGVAMREFPRSFEKENNQVLLTYLYVRPGNGSKPSSHTWEQIRLSSTTRNEGLIA